ncbi:MAG: hypothetical protein ACJ74H_15310 [Thermoanaerobaculia bacterium]
MNRYSRCGPNPARKHMTSTNIEEPSHAATPLPPPPPRPRPLAVPTRTLPLLAILIVTGSVMLIFASRTVHRWNTEELQKDATAVRSHFQTTYWLEHGYFNSGGLLVYKSATIPLFFYKSSTGGVYLAGFWVEKIYSAFTGHYSWRLMALQNQIFTMIGSAVFALLGFRLARLMGAEPLHALMLAICLQAVHFTFPDNLMTYWEMSARIPWLLFACIFLLLEIETRKRRTRALTIAQGFCAFALTYMEFVAGVTFVTSYLIAAILLSPDRPSWKRLFLISLVPMLLALGVFKVQLAWVRATYPDVPLNGSEFLFRTGLDGSLKLYGDHLDIFRRRDVPRRDFIHSGEWAFRWKWLFLSSTAALLWMLFLAMRGRIPATVTISILSLLGAYLLYAALFSQAMVIHPYLYDVMIHTPLILVLFVIAPSFVETISRHRGVAVVAIFFLAVWISMGQMRRYAVMYPEPPKQTQP